MPAAPLPPMRRIVTGHNTAAQSVIASDTRVSSQILPQGAGSVLIWANETSPADLDQCEGSQPVEPGFTNNGSIFRVVDIPPRTVGVFHRSISLDYIIVQKGSVVLTLEDGSKTTVNQGEFVIQQATMHGWDNETDEWARFLAIMLPAKNPAIGEKELKEDLTAFSAAL